MRLSGRGSPHAPCRRPHRCSREDLWGTCPHMGIEPQRRVSYYASAPAFDSHSLFIIVLHYVRAFEIRELP